MDGFTSRPLLISDLPTLLEIELAAERAEPSEKFVDLVQLEQELHQPGVDLGHGSIAVLSGESIVGAGLLHTRPGEQTWKAGIFGAVRPEFRRRGIGRMILSSLQEKALALRRQADRADWAELPGELQMWVSEGRVAAASFAAAAGFTNRRYFFDMRADLAQVVRTPPVDDIDIRGWDPTVDDAARLAYNEAFADHWGSTPMDPDRWRTSFAGSVFFRPEFSRVALAEGQVVGFVMVTEFPAQTAARGYRTGYIDRVGSIRSVRGRGVAAAMVTDSMGAQRESGCRCAELGVDADSPTGAGRLYERLGYSLQHTNQVLGLDF